MDFEFHTPGSAPNEVVPELQAAEKAFGVVPNLYRGLATSPAALKIYLIMNEMLQAHGRLSPVEQQVVYLTVSAENGCDYCMGAHSMPAKMTRIPEQALTELRQQRSLTDARLDALRRFALKKTGLWVWATVIVWNSVAIWDALSAYVIHVSNPWPDFFMIETFGSSMFFIASAMHVAIIYLITRNDMKQRLLG